MKIIMMLSAFAVMCFTSLAVDVTPELARRSIVLSAIDAPFVFGRVSSLIVSYRNGGQEPWVVPVPSESISVRLCYRLSGSEQYPQGYSLGRITTTTFKGSDGREAEVRVFPNPKPISIAPGHAHAFKIVFERDWTGDLKPGLWAVWIEDNTSKLKSNCIEIPLVFTADSVAACLEIVTDDKQQVYKRKEHARWLQKIKPDLKFRWWPDLTPAQERQKKQEEIQQKLATFQAFWKDKSKTNMTESAIFHINQEAGVEKWQ